MKTKFISFVALVAAAFLIAGCVQPAPPPDPEPEMTWQEEMLHSVNAYRAAAGVQTVDLCGNLSTAAQRHADDMSLNDFLGHTGTDGSSIFDRVTDAGYGSFWPAELLATRLATASAVVDLWYADALHNPLLLDPNWTHLGAGRSELGGGTNDPYWVALLGQGGDCGSA